MTTPALLAILLVTSSDLSSPSKHLLFHYPPHPSPYAENDEDILGDSSSDNSSILSAPSASSIASIPSSKYSRLTGDNGRYTVEDDEEHHDGIDRDEDDDEPCWRRKPSRLTEWEQPLFGLSKRDLADILIPKDSLCNRKFELGIEDIVFLGQPVHLVDLHDRNGNVLATSPSSSINDDADVETVVHRVKLTKFHIVFVMNPSWRLDYHEQVQKMYNEIVTKFTEACVVEQRERGYVSLEALKIHKLMRGAEDNELPMSLVWEELIHSSNLAHAISALYNSIIHSKVAFIDLNNSAELAFHIKQISQISSLPEIGTNPFNEKNIPLLTTSHGFGETEDQADQVLAPKHALLLMDEAAEILKKVPSRPLHRRQNWLKFLTIKPTTSFRRHSRDQKLPLSLVMSMARELIDLDLGRAIPPLSNRGIYTISPLSPISTLPSQALAFKTRFPSAPSLTTLLAAISSGEPKRWDSILYQYDLSFDVLPYLMRAGWLVQLHQFYFIRIPRRIKLICIPNALERRAAEDVAEDSILPDPFRATKEEVKWIRRLAEEVGGGKGRMFERLVKYFDGKSAKEKILRREQVEKGELDEMIEAVRNVGGMIVAEHW